MTELIIFVIAVLTEGFFSGSEIAIVSSDNGQLLTLAKQKNRRAKDVLELKQNPINFLTVCLIGTNLSAATASFAGTLFFLEHVEKYREFAVFFIIPVMMTFGEIIPKTLYSRFATPISLTIVGVIKFLSILLKPAVILLNKWSSMVSSFVKREEDLITRDEFFHMLDREKNCLPPHLRDIIDRFKDGKNIEKALFGDSDA